MSNFEVENKLLWTRTGICFQGEFFFSFSSQLEESSLRSSLRGDRGGSMEWAGGVLSVCLPLRLVLCLTWDEIPPRSRGDRGLFAWHPSVSRAGQSRPPLPCLPSRCILQALQGAVSVSQRITAPSPWASRATACTSVDSVPAELERAVYCPVLSVLQETV